MAPTEELKTAIAHDRMEIEAFAAAIHRGEIKTSHGEKFKHVLIIGIGGSALGPQLVREALGTPEDKMSVYFLDNTDPDGFDRLFATLGEHLLHTLVVVTSKSGGTKETRNGMLETQAQFTKLGAPFAPHMVAVTGRRQRSRQARDQGRLAQTFPMYDWWGGRTFRHERRRPRARPRCKAWTSARFSPAPPRWTPTPARRKRCATWGCSSR